MKLVTLALLLSAFSSLTLTEVVENLNEWKSKCHDYFIPNPKDRKDVITPTVFTDETHKMICQSWKNKYRFATLYDTERRIPVYSAYTFAQEVETKRKNFWKYEPQLENISDQKDMKNFPKNRTTNLIHQAANSDYTNSGMKLVALVLLLSALPSRTLTEVVRSFSQACPSFFMLNPRNQNARIVPTIFKGRRFKKICQRWNEGNRFATVYDTVRRIPVYSAYTFKQQANTVRNEDWKIEPQ
ncbi:endonuclease domain-containing 1 protein-like, partial [Clarias magur]